MKLPESVKRVLINHELPALDTKRPSSVTGRLGLTSCFMAMISIS